MKKENIMKWLAYVSIATFFCSACSHNSLNMTESVSSETDISLSQSSYIENRSDSKSSESGQEKDVLFPNIYNMNLTWNGYLILSFNREKAINLMDGIGDMYLEYKYSTPDGDEFYTTEIEPEFADIKNGILLGSQGSYGRQYVTCNLLTGEWFVSDYVSSNWYPPHIWDNNIIGQISNAYIEGVDIRPRPIFLNTRCEELPLELDFDYGEVFIIPLDSELSSEKYIMVGLTYDGTNSQYIAVYAINPFWNTTDAISNSHQCELGVAIFDENGKQLERYRLPRTIYPSMYFSKSNIISDYPQLVVFDNKLLIVSRISGVPNDVDYEYYKQNLELLLILVNLETHEYKCLTDEEAEQVLPAELILYREIDIEHGRAFGNWKVKRSMPDPPFQIVEKGNIQYVYISGEEKALFAVPSELKLQLWGETEDGMYHAVFSKYQQ